MSHAQSLFGPSIPILIPSLELEQPLVAPLGLSHSLAAMQGSISNATVEAFEKAAKMMKTEQPKKDKKAPEGTKRAAPEPTPKELKDFLPKMKVTQMAVKAENMLKISGSTKALLQDKQLVGKLLQKDKHAKSTPPAPKREADCAVKPPPFKK